MLSHMKKKFFLILLTTANSLSGFWLGQSTSKSLPVIKQAPISYFRTLMFQPLSYPGYNIAQDHESESSYFAQMQTMPNTPSSGFYKKQIVTQNNRESATRDKLKKHENLNQNVSKSENYSMPLITEVTTTEKPSSEKANQQKSEVPELIHQKSYAYLNYPAYPDMDLEAIKIKLIPCMCPLLMNNVPATLEKHFTNGNSKTEV